MSPLAGPSKSLPRRLTVLVVLRVQLGRCLSPSHLGLQFLPRLDSDSCTSGTVFILLGRMLRSPRNRAAELGIILAKNKEVRVRGNKRNALKMHMAEVQEEGMRRKRKPAIHMRQQKDSLTFPWSRLVLPGRGKAATIAGDQTGVLAPQ